MQIEALTKRIVNEVKHIEGVRGIVLGGSRARGTHTPLPTSIWAFTIIRMIRWTWWRWAGLPHNSTTNTGQT